MWVLIHWEKGSLRYPPYTFTTGRDHVVSCKKGDLVITNDSSISRKHAVFSVSYDYSCMDDPRKLPKIVVKDTNSTYGTFFNQGISKHIPIGTDTCQVLTHGDHIRFGKKLSLWRLDHVPLVVTTSTLSPSEKKAVKENIFKLGGHLVSNWRDEVTHVTMSSLTLTVKVVCALAHGRYIVTPQFWEKCLDGLPTSKPFPDTKDYLPPLAEASLNMNEVSFEINEERRTLFLGYKFIFSSQVQFNNYSCMIQAAGGRPLMMCDDFTFESLRSPDVIVMQCTPKHSQDSSVPSSFEKISKYLKEHNLRPIPDSEIALAILHCSTEKHCNPEFNVASMLLTNDSRNSHLEKHNITLALDSQQHTESKSLKQDKSHKVLIIPESGTVRKESTSRVPLQHSIDDTMIIPESGTPKKSSSPSKLPISHTEKNDDDDDDDDDDDVILIKNTSRRTKEKRERSSSTDNVDPSPSPLKRIKVFEKEDDVKQEVGQIDAHEATSYVELPKKIKKEEKRHSSSPESFKYPKKRKDIDSEIKPISKKRAMDIQSNNETIEQSDSSEDEKYQRKDIYVHKKPKVKKLICVKIVESGEIIGMKGKNFKKFVKNSSSSIYPPIKKEELRKYPKGYINNILMKYKYDDDDEEDDDDDDEDDNWNSITNGVQNRTHKKGR